jgi:hypothetical protein
VNLPVPSFPGISPRIVKKQNWRVIMNNSKSLLIFIAIVSLMLAAGCGKDDNNPTDPGDSVPSELVDTWLYQSVTLNGVPWSLGQLLGWDPGTVAARFTVGSDESFVYEELDTDSAVVWTEWGTFTVDGNSATITRTENDDGPINPPETRSGTWAVNGDTLSLNTIEQGVTAAFIAVRY